jgi:hypothetical protein
MTGYYDLSSYYKTNFSLMQHHNYTMADIENWLPFERDIYVHMLIEHLKEEKKRFDEEQARIRSQSRR